MIYLQLEKNETWQAREILVNGAASTSISRAENRLWVRVPEGNNEIVEKVDHVISVPSNLPPLQPVLTTIPLQLLAYHMAVLRGCDVDQPRNLAKSVTVE